MLRYHTDTIQIMKWVYGAQVASRLTPEILQKAALHVAHKVAAHARRRQQALATRRRASASYRSLQSECGGAMEWSDECAQARQDNVGPDALQHVASGHDRFADDDPGNLRKTVARGDDQDIDFRYPRGQRYPVSGDGAKGRSARGARVDARAARHAARAAYGAAVRRDVGQGGGGDTGGGEEVSDDAPRYRWVHHRSQVFRRQRHDRGVEGYTRPPSARRYADEAARDTGVIRRRRGRGAATSHSKAAADMAVRRDADDYDFTKGDKPLWRGSRDVTRRNPDGSRRWYHANQQPVSTPVKPPHPNLSPTSASSVCTV